MWVKADFTLQKAFGVGGLAKATGAAPSASQEALEATPTIAGVQEEVWVLLSINGCIHQGLGCNALVGLLLQEAPCHVRVSDAREMAT